MKRIDVLTAEFFDALNGWRPIDYETLVTLNEEDVSDLVSRILFNGHGSFDGLSDDQRTSLFEKWASHPNEETRSYIASILVNFVITEKSEWKTEIYAKLLRGMSDPRLIDSIRAYVKFEEQRN